MEQFVSQEQIDFYRQNGFVQVDQVFNEEEIAELTEAIEEAMSAESDRTISRQDRGSAYYKVLNQKVNVWRDHGVMAKYSLHPRLARIALDLSGAGGIRLFHDHALWKMPQDSQPTPWHQDFPYWPMNEPGALSAWIPLDDVDDTNGCMMFVPGSQNAGKLAPIQLADPANLFDYVEDRDLANRRPVQVPLKKGSCTFHSGLTFHYAHANKTDRPRRVLAIIYMPDGTTYSGKKHIVSDSSGFQVNEPIRGGLFPLLAKQAR